MDQNEIPEPSVIKRIVRPVGNLLNDNDSGVDQLGYLVYAEALAKLLNNCHPPITVGIFGPWGIGKTFLLKHVQGLLRKYEQQEKYDEACAVKKDSRQRRRNFTEEDGANDALQEELACKKIVNKTYRRNLKRGWTNICWALVILLIIVTLFALFITWAVLESSDIPPEKETTTPTTPPTRTRGVKTEISSNETRSGSNNEVSGRIFPLKPQIGNLTEGLPTLYIGTTTAVTDTEETEVIAENVRLYVILALVLFTAMVFGVFCCCIANTSSKCWPRFLCNYKLIFYAAFTRLPLVTVSPTSNWMEANNPYMVTHFNDDLAELSFLDPSDGENVKGAHITSREVRRMPTKYIFVNYHAWQYAGSDTLWAGIVTNLSEAIENEFGAVCARLFRMMQVERPSKSGPLKRNLRQKEDPRSIYVRFRFSNGSNWSVAKKRERVETVMREYGVVTQCSVYKESSWWFVRFCSDKEADFAERALKLDNFEVSRPRPIGQQSKEEPSSSPENTSPDERDSREPTAPLMRPPPNDCVIQKSPVRSNDIPMITISPPSKRDRCFEADERVHDDVPTWVTQKAPAREVTRNCCPSFCCCCHCRCLAHFHRHPKNVCCGCPFLYCCILFAVAAVMFPTTVVILTEYLELGVLKSTRAIPVEVQIFSWLPAVLGVLIVALRFCWAMCNSQTERIRKALAGTAGSMGNALGFMNDVKSEVMIMTNLINCVRFTHGINYKIIITIDDLDRCPYNKVKSVLEAVSILLSDRASPFLCLVAVDSRVAVKCIEQDMGEVLLQAHLTGHEYLKKIINLPFCLPEVANRAKRKYFGGIMDIADDTTIRRAPTIRMNRGVSGPELPQRPSHDQLDAVGLDASDVTLTDGMGGSLSGTRTRTKIHGKSTEVATTSREMQFSEFLFKCRELLDGDGTAGRFIHEHMCGNPRNMKRIFNVLSLTTRLMQCIQERRTRLDYRALHSQGTHTYTRDRRNRRPSIMNSDFRLQQHAISFGRNLQDADDLVRWVVATDQWPYRISYVLQVVEDCDQRLNAGLEEPVIKDDCTLSTIYESYVEPEMANQPNSSSMSTLDEDPAVLRSFLRGSPSLTRGRIASLFPVTLNLDQSLRNGISRQRSNAANPRLNNPTAGGERGSPEASL